MRGQGPWADLLRTRFEVAAKKYSLRQANFQLRTDIFQPPQGDQMRLLLSIQLSLLWPFWLATTIEGIFKTLI